MNSAVEGLVFVKSGTEEDVIVQESYTNSQWMYREIVWCLLSKGGLGNVCILWYKENIKHCQSFDAWSTPQVQTSYFKRGNGKGKIKKGIYQIIPVINQLNAQNLLL